MDASHSQVIELMENLPCRLDRFWKARILKLHQD
jgi:hypothetical protein